jgi:septal ring factor EnvC (AmiA/AmiB activator)
MNVKELQRQHEAITRDLQGWRTRRDGVAQRLESARTRLDELAGRRATAVAELEPDEKAVGGLRRQLAAGRDEIEELAASLQAADARIAELATAEQALTMRRQAVVLSEMLAQTEGKAEAFARAQEAANQELERFLLAKTECERFAAGLSRGPSTPPTPVLSGATLGRVALWRLNERLDDVSGPLGLIEPSYRRPLRDFWREAWRPLRESLEAIVRGR